MTRAPLTPYQRRLIGFLSVATFFEGYDFLAISQILPQLRAEMHLSEGTAGALIAFTNIGAILAYLLVRHADIAGRRTTLTITIAGYTLCTAATGAATGLYSFAILQLLARFFLLAEWSLCMVYAAEEFPADRRGQVIGVIQAASSLGSIACAALVPVLIRSPLGWRTVFLAGIVPLVLVGLARTGLRETQRFEAVGRQKRSLTDVWRSGYATRILQLAALWGLTYTCTQTAVTFWKEFVVRERQFTDVQVGASMTVAAVGSLPLLLAVGPLLDTVGRRRGAVLIYATTIIGVVLAYNLHGQWPLTAALVLGIFGASAVLPILNAYSTELFPTDLRGDAYAWANNLLGRISYVIAPLLVGQAAAHVGWGAAVSVTAVGPMLALALIWAWMPETAGRELEQTAALH
jgi:putative MFS transporter